MDSIVNTRPRQWLAIAITTVAYFACALMSLALTDTMDGIAFLWPASGVAVAALALNPARLRYHIAAGIAVASLAANLFDGTALLQACGFTVANVAECLIVAHFLGRGGCNPPVFDDRDCLLGLGVGTLVASAASAAIATPFADVPGIGVAFFASWFCTVALGILITAPLLVEMFRPFAFPGYRQPAVRWPARVAAVAFATIIALAAFSQTDYPMLFLTLAAVIFASFVTGIGGAVGSVFVIALIGSALTTSGYGPINSIMGSIKEEVVYFQFYLLTLLACGLPAASLLAEVRRNAAKLAERNRLLAMAEETAKVGHWRLDLGAMEVFWSPEVFRINGMEPSGETVAFKTALEAYHPDDRDRIRQAFDAALASRQPFFYEARVLTPDGSLRHTESHAKIDVEADGTLSVFGTLLDVTEKAEAIDALKEARRAAERQAETALRLAETDQLTGIANRRKLMDRLEEAIAQAGRAEAPLSFVMFDVDNFKAINDTHGHGQGDQVLTRIARISHDCLRKADLVGRLGGEEFGVILPQTDLTTASRIAERIRAAIEDQAARGLPFGPLSVSLGVAEWKPGKRRDELLGAADVALYQAKANGKNCLRLAA